MKLIFVELNNFRTHEHVVFSPKDGVTAIVGPNGSGKSSIVDAIAWAMYGIKPESGKLKKLTNKQLVRDGVVIKKGVKCGVTVKIEDGDNVIIIERKIVTKAGSVECVVSIEKDGELTEVAGPAVSHAESYLKRLLTLDADSFLTACFVQQKQVDELVTSKDKGKVIENLTGITVITKSLRSAKDEVNIQKRLMANYDFDEVLYSELKKEYEKKSVEANKCSRAIVQMEEKLSEFKDKKNKLKSDVALMNKEIISRERAEKIIAESNIEEMKIRKKDLVTQGNKIKKELALHGDVDRSDINKKFDESSRTIATLKNGLHEAERLNEEARVAREELSRYNKDDIVERQQETSRAISQTSTDLSRLQSKREILQGDRKKITKSIAEIQSGESDKCPTCHREYSDVRSIISHLQEEIVSIDKDILRFSQEEEEASNKLNELKELEVKAQNQLATINDLEGVIAKEVKESEVLKIKTDINMESALFASISASKEKLAVMDSESQRLLAIGNEVKELDVAIKEVSHNIREALAVVKDKQGFNYSTYEKKLENLRKAEDIEESKANKLNEAKRIGAEIALRVATLKERISQLEEVKNKYSTALKEQSRLMSVVQDLSDFKLQRTSKSLSTIVATASDFVSRFTNGKITQVIMDKKFSIQAKVKGVVREANELSGGEMSAVSMALRLAISKSLSRGGFVILDEVFVSQDRERADTMLSVIKDVFGGQVVVISHTNSLGDMADNVFALPLKEK